MAPKPQLIVEMALEAGFDLVAFGPPDPGALGERFEDWLEAGRHGKMQYLERNRERILDPQSWLPGSHSSICLAYDYSRSGPGEKGSQAPQLPGGGRIARYARGRDYHRFLGKATRKVQTLLLAEGLPRESLRMGPDAVPILERALAVQAGIGFLAKSSGLISPSLGPYLLLSEILSPLDLAADDTRPGPGSPGSPGSCGSCTACLEACPTGALVAPYQLDARSCLSYSTIELRGFIPEPLRRAQGDWLFGCDVCLEVCPFTSKSQGRHGDSPDLQPHPVLETYELQGILELSEQDYQEQWVGTAMRRATRSGLRRNAAVVLGNLGRGEAIPALVRSLADPDPVVRGHAAWALGQNAPEHQALEQQLQNETDPQVERELRAALDRR